MVRRRNLRALSAQEQTDIIDVALGKKKADTVVVNARLVNVYTGEVLPGHSAAVKGRRIAYVGANAEHCIGADTDVIDAGGKVLVPGMVESHTHIVHYYGPLEFVRHVMLAGTTTVVAEVHEQTYAFGYRGFLEYLRCLRGQPIKVLLTVPAQVTFSPASERVVIHPAEARKALREPDVVGLGEAYWLAVIQGDRRIRALFRETLAVGKSVEGHTAGARGEKLAAYAAAGATSCHEPITPEEITERLRLGMYVLLRQGSVRRDLDALKPLLKENIDLRRVALAADGASPSILLRGYLDVIAQEAVNMGVPPVQAIQMVTLNPAEHFGLDATVGGIAPHRYADMVLIPELDRIQPEWVMSDGRIVARDGKPVVDVRPHAFPGWFRDCFPEAPGFTAGDFAVLANMPEGAVTVRVIHYVTPLVTHEARVEMPVAGGGIPMDVSRDLLKVSALDLRMGAGKKAVGFIRGVGLKEGAIASSYVWDSANVVVVGANEADMALALNRLVELKGAAVIAVDGRIVCELPLNVSGFFSELPLETVAVKAKEFQDAAAGIGCVFPDVILSMGTLPTPAIPHIRMVETGLVNVRTGKGLDLLVR